MMNEMRGQSEGRPGSGVLNDPLNAMAGGPGDPRPGSGMVSMSPRDEDGSRLRQQANNAKPCSDGSRPESAGKRSESDINRPGSKMMMAQSDNDLRPGSALDLMDPAMRPGSALMMGMPGGPGEARMRCGPGHEIIGPDGNMRPGSALMMGMGPGEMRSRPDMMMMEQMEMMRPDMMQMGMGDGGMRPMGMNPGGAELMGGEVRMRPGSATMMMGMDGPLMGPGESGGMMMMGPGGEVMSMNEFDPRGCPPDMMNSSHRMGPRMMSPQPDSNPGGTMRYNDAGHMLRMNRPRAELDFRMLSGMESNMRGPFGGPMRNGGCTPDRQMMMMMNSGGPMQPGDFGPGMGPPLGPNDGAHFQQFQQQLYATKGHHPQQGPPSPSMMMMMDSRSGGPAGNFAQFDTMQNGPPVRYGPPGSGVM